MEATTWTATPKSSGRRQRRPEIGDVDAPAEGGELRAEAHPAEEGDDLLRVLLVCLVKNHGARGVGAGLDAEVRRPVVAVGRRRAVLARDLFVEGELAVNVGPQ